MFKRLIPESFMRVLRPLRLYYHVQSRFDRRFKVDTAGMIEPDQLGVEGMNVNEAGLYEPTPAATFFRIMKSIPLEYDRYVFVDLGSGKGAVLLYAAEFPFKRILGIEFSPLLHQIAERNIASYCSRTRKCTEVKSLCGDVTACPIPPEPTVFYLFNPFKGTVLETLVARVRRSLEDHPRDVLVIYYHPLSRHSTWDRAEFLRQVRLTPDHTIYWSLPTAKETVRPVSSNF